MSDDKLTIARQRRLLEQFGQLVGRRAHDEVAIPQAYAERDEQLNQDYKNRRQQLQQGYHNERTRLETEYEEAQIAVEKQYDDDSYDIASDLDRTTKRIRTQFKQQRQTAKDERDRLRHEAIAEFDGAKEAPIKAFARIKQLCQQQRQAIGDLRAEADHLLASRRIRPRDDETYDPVELDEKLSLDERFTEAMMEARESLTRMELLIPARFIYEGWPILLFIFLALAGIVPAGIFMGWTGWLWIIAIAFGGSLAVNGLLCMVILPLARGRTSKLYSDCRRQLAAAEAAAAETFAGAKNEYEPKYGALVAERDRRVSAAEATWKKVASRLESERDRQLDEINQSVESRRSEISQRRKAQLAELEQRYPPMLQELKEQHQQQLAELQQEHERQIAESRRTFEAQWSNLVQDWKTGVATLDAAADEMNGFCNRRFPSWDAIDFDSWQSPADAPPAVRYGQFDIKTTDFEGGLPQHEDLTVETNNFSLPGILTFPECPSLLLKAEEECRDAAVRVMQNVMLRLLTAMPAGKVRFTIIDPTGRGQNFSAFMHLADFDEQLVSNRIWTESTHINRRLTDVTEHMENVIQKYLRNEFESIQDYNEEAGEVAEAYRVLVVANYPAGFSEEAARRLMSIASSGARCGVATLISVDTKLAATRKFDLSDLEAAATTLLVTDGKFQFQDDKVRRFPLAVGEPPGDALFTTAVRTVGQAAKDSSRVEVPFASVLPEEGNWWTSDSRGGVDVSLGRAGATKLQYMRLGQGTSQHVLIAGKTGSGKSTLLNAMITNLAAFYSPDELEFYLVDFKKGVEFKPYASYELPQARVVAIESEREFGLSVLQRLDEELKRRGDLFRKAGVQGVSAFRDAHPDQRMPRILLIVDEFQELFVADDRVARESGLLMDRLVRQGRAFGIHVILGTQTLAGAYSLARSTVGQMAVRIALQCSESDAHLILSEDNTAARLLNRPGAAIYNDANGLVEGNHPFQVVWLPDHEREACLRQIGDLAASRSVKMPPAVVFEGNVPSDPQDNHLLHEIVQHGPAQPNEVPRAWLGSSVAIKDPTYVTFARHAGTNLLVVGQHDELAMGVASSSAVALAAHHAGTVADDANKAAGDGSDNGEAGAADAPQFIILDGTRPDEPIFGMWRRVARSLSLSAEVFEPKETSAALDRAAAVLQRRMDAADDSAPPLYLVVFNLGRFRDLQKKEDSFGFSGFGEEEGEKSSPGKQFAQILRDGPDYGVHTLIWCDSYNNLNRWVDRNTIRDLELRVLFQMSATDSSNLIDSPAASQLGVNRAILYNDERGEYEKLRPYGLPSDEWLAWVRRTLGQRFGVSRTHAPSARVSQ